MGLVEFLTASATTLRSKVFIVTPATSRIRSPAKSLSSAGLLEMTFVIKTMLPPSVSSSTETIFEIYFKITDYSLKFLFIHLFIM